VKLQKYIAHAWICSRRKAEEYIEKWLVTVNGVVAHIGQVIDPDSDSVSIDDQLIRDTENLVYYVYHKPRDIVTTCLSGKEGEKWILDVVSFPERVFPVGRLDKETTGLIIMTNDGRLSNYLMHPRYEHEKEYIVEVYGKIEDEALEKMRRGVKIELKENGSRKKIIRRIGGKDTIITRKYTTAPCVITRLSSSKFSIVLKEWKNRQIRRMVDAVEHDVKRLKRIRIEHIFLGELKEGEYRRFTPSELRSILEKIENISQAHLDTETDTTEDQ
jgi:pseudouridine synthase